MNTALTTHVSIESTTPDEDGVFTVQTSDGPENFCLIPVLTMEEAARKFLGCAPNAYPF